MKLHSFAIIFVLLFLSVLEFSEAITGGWNPIKNIKDPEVLEIAQFAVTEHQKQSGQKLSLVEVISGETQVVAGLNYRLVLTAKDGSVTKKYQAQVVDQLTHTRILTSFKSLP
ncbi:cysteine proteinase inhibitor 1-like [Lathyrus oleraceus]|uniref:cysteine proteinase inhibitor 1-like n=1 Tax=Pisum sativum TaxID=3888 RepID=UPI0021D2CF63|nr:cysteine proteinase inhibitor 1-like [Pisum sativum]